MTQPSPNLDQTETGHLPISPADIESFEYFPDSMIAERITARAVFIDTQDRQTFAERGMLAEYVEKRELWRHCPAGKLGDMCRSQNEWIEVYCPFSRASWFDAKRRWMELKDVPAREKIQIPRGNLIVMNLIPESIRKEETILTAAKSCRESNQFIDEVNRQHPELHLEKSQILKVRVDESNTAVLEEAVGLAMRLGAKTRGLAMQTLAEEFIEAHRDDYECMIRESA